MIHGLGCRVFGSRIQGIQGLGLRVYLEALLT